MGVVKNAHPLGVLTVGVLRAAQRLAVHRWHRAASGRRRPRRLLPSGPALAAGHPRGQRGPHPDDGGRGQRPAECQQHRLCRSPARDAPQRHAPELVPAGIRLGRPGLCLTRCHKRRENQ
jgi:hypothetical protein